MFFKDLNVDLSDENIVNKLLVDNEKKDKHECKYRA